MNFITDFADQATVLPLAATVAAVLLLQRRWRLAGAWVVAIGSVLGLLLILKLADFACGWRVPLLGPGGLDLSSPSGHTGAATVTFGAIAGLLASRSQFGIRGTVVIAAVVAGILIGITRLMLGVHSMAEVVLAFGIGLIGAGLFAALAGREERPRSAVPVLAASVVVIIWAHGARLQAETVLHGVWTEAVRHWVTYCQPQANSGMDAALAWNERGRLVRLVRS